MDERDRALERFDLVHGLNAHGKQPSFASVGDIVVKVVMALFVIALFFGAIVYVFLLLTGR